MGGKSPPRAPDPYETASAQSQANAEAIRESARVNRYDSYSPFGSSTWERTYTGGDTPEQAALRRQYNNARAMGSRSGVRATTRLAHDAGMDLTSDGRGEETWTHNVELSPEQQEQLNQQRAVASGLGDIAMDRVSTIPGGDFNLSGINELRTDFDTQGGELEQATYDRAMQLMAPGFEQQERRLSTGLANQGLPMGGEAYDTEMGNFRRSRNEAELAAALESVGRGRQEQSRLFGLNQAARQQGISDRMLERTQPMNELAALLQGSPALQSPHVPQTAQYQQAPADISGMIQNQYNQQSQNANAAKGGTTSLIGSGIGAAAMYGKSVAMCIPEGQMIDTPNGPLPIEAFKPGDMVIGFDGEPVKVTMHHAYLEDPEPKRFARVVIGDAVINLCDKHRIKDIPSEALQVGDIVDGKRVESIEWYNGVERSYDLLTEDSGYQIGGVPVNSMIEEMMRSVK